MKNVGWSLRYTQARETIIEDLRKKLQESGREVETVHGIVTNASVFDHALIALHRELTAELEKPQQSGD